MKHLANKYKKYFYILPAVLLLFYSINSIGKTKESKVKSSEIIIDKIKDDTIKIKIDKTTSDSNISDIMTSLKEKGITAEFTDIQRNEDNEITAIKINITKNGSTSSYSANSNMGINTIIIDIDGDFVSIHNEGVQVFGFGNSNNQDDDEISKLIQQQRAFMNNHSNGMDEIKKMIEQQRALFQSLNMDDDAFFSNKTDNEDDDYFNFKETTKNVYIVNGKQMSEEAYRKMDKSKINSLVIKKEIVKTYAK